MPARFRRNVRERFLIFLCGGVLPMFLLHYVALFSRKLAEILSSCQVRVLEGIFGSEFLFLAFVSGWCFWCCFAYVSASLCGLVLPKVARKHYLLSGARFGRSFRERAFVFNLCVRLVFLVLFAYGFALLYGIVLPKAGRKIIFLSGAFFGNIFREQSFVCVQLVLSCL